MAIDVFAQARKLNKLEQDLDSPVISTEDRIALYKKYLETNGYTVSSSSEVSSPAVDVEKPNKFQHIYGPPTHNMCDAQVSVYVYDSDDEKDIRWKFGKEIAQLLQQEIKIEHIIKDYNYDHYHPVFRLKFRYELVESNPKAGPRLPIYRRKFYDTGYV